MPDQDPPAGGAAPDPSAAAPIPSPTPNPIEETAAAPATPASPPAPADPAAAPAAPPAADDPFGGMDQVSIDELLKQANFEDPSIAAAAAGSPSFPDSATAVADLPDTSPMRLPDFNQVMQDAQVSSIDLLRDVDLNVKIELGRSRMLVEDVLKLAEGSVVELDKLAGDPVDVFVNDRLVARGEVLVLNDNFCVRINEIVAGVREEGL
jgi:flagellar motor switch protein FliN/FliY